MSVLMIGQIGSQIGKITVFRVTGQVRPSRKILRIFNTIQHQLNTCFLSKNLILHKNPSIIAPFNDVEQSLPTT
jgi:hypothetical protein